MLFYLTLVDFYTNLWHSNKSCGLESAENAHGGAVIMAQSLPLKNILMPAIIMALALYGVSHLAKPSQVLALPKADYVNYWSGETLSPEELRGAAWDVINIVPTYDLLDPNESVVNTVEVSRIEWTPGETTFYVGDWAYADVEFEKQLDEGNLN